jgi:DNA polymerase
MFAGEQPGDREGAPFVGPAGPHPRQGAVDAGIERGDAYVTNVVKHFRWKPAPRGKRRIHETPEARHIAACRPWLIAKLSAVRGPYADDQTTTVEAAFATVHPSAVLRADDREDAYDHFVRDLQVVARSIKT